MDRTHGRRPAIRLPSVRNGSSGPDGRIGGRFKVCRPSKVRPLDDGSNIGFVKEPCDLVRLEVAGGVERARQPFDPCGILLD